MVSYLALLGLWIVSVFLIVMLLMQLFKLQGRTVSDGDTSDRISVMVTFWLIVLLSMGIGLVVVIIATLGNVPLIGHAMIASRVIPIFSILSTIFTMLVWRHYGQINTTH